MIVKMRYAISASAMIPTMMFSIMAGQTFAQAAMKAIIRAKKPMVARV